ncbi:hypothetical protein M758_6G072800 [Ceratodon purpureus]|nr:hypothetical protein M758_6G072800 [Ceratodon purpureus]
MFPVTFAYTHLEWELSFNFFLSFFQTKFISGASNIKSRSVGIAATSSIELYVFRSMTASLQESTPIKNLNTPIFSHCLHCDQIGGWIDRKRHLEFTWSSRFRESSRIKIVNTIVVTHNHIVSIVIKSADRSRNALGVHDHLKSRSTTVSRIILVVM